MRQLAVIALLALAPSASSQRTIVVDWLGGAGSHYKLLGKAIGAAQDGDIILVRAGTYAWPTTPLLSKGITVQGTGSGTTVTGFVYLYRIPFGRSFVLKDVVLTYGIVVVECRGSVLIDRVGALHLAGSSQIAVMLSLNVMISQCKRIHLNADRSFVRIEGGDITLPGPFPIYISPIEAKASLIEIADARIEGGLRSFPANLFQVAAIHAVDAEIRVRGRLCHLIVQKGSGQYGATSYAPVLDGDNTSKLTLDPVVKLTHPMASVKRIRGFRRGVVLRALPTLRSSGPPTRGQLWSYSLESQTNDPFAIAIGWPSPPLPLLGEFLHLDPHTLIVLHIGRQPANGVSTFTFRPPTLPNLRGHALRMQGVAGSNPRLTNPIAFSVR